MERDGRDSTYRRLVRDVHSGPVRAERVLVLSLTRCRELLPPGSRLTDAELVEVVDRLYQLAEVVYSCAKSDPAPGNRPTTKMLDFTPRHD